MSLSFVTREAFRRPTHESAPLDYRSAPTSTLAAGLTILCRSARRRGDVPFERGSVQRPTTLLIACSLLTTLTATTAVGGKPAEQRLETFGQLRASVPHLTERGREEIRELELLWLADAAGTGFVRPADRRPLDQLSVLRERRRIGTMPAARYPRLAGDRLVAVARDSRGRQIGWLTIPDPRIVRAEFPGPDGILRGETLYRAEAVFLLALPADAEVRSIELLEPDPRGPDLALRAVARCSLPR